MILHYLKIAWRNLLKYRMQTAVNVVGIAVGFACFAFANLWMRYEASFDSRYEAADRMYLVYTESAIESGGFSPNVSYPTSTLLKQEFPEVEAACAFTRYPNWELGLEGQPALEFPSMQLDSCFMDLFDIRILAGTPDFLYTDGQVALTERTAQRLFGTTDVLGRTVVYNDQKATVSAVVNDLPHSNFSFGFICEGTYFRKWQDVWYNGGFEVVVRLAPGVSPRALEEKFRAYAERVDDRNRKITGHLRLMPLSEVRQASFNEERLVSFSYLVLFAAAGGLVILCSLFNHLALFLSRMDPPSRTGLAAHVRFFRQRALRDAHYRVFPAHPAFRLLRLCAGRVATDSLPAAFGCGGQCVRRVAALFPDGAGVFPCIVAALRPPLFFSAA